MLFTEFRIQNRRCRRRDEQVERRPRWLRPLPDNVHGRRGGAVHVPTLLTLLRRCSVGYVHRPIRAFEYQVARVSILYLMLLNLTLPKT